jgi:precorrin-6B methylase 2
MAKVTPQDFVMDLGSGDGRNVIAAAKRGARGLGVEYNPDMVELSRRLAREAGVADKATFVQGDMYEADVSKATVLALFLLPSNLEKLKDKFLALPPGTRIVMNTFTVPGWQADVTEQLTDGCESWCTALLHIVPAKVAGRWRFDGGELVLGQEFQMLSGSVSAGGATTPVAEGRMNGDQMTVTVAGTTYTGRVTGDRITGTATRAGTKREWTATRVAQ